MNFFTIFLGMSPPKIKIKFRNCLALKLLGGIRGRKLSELMLNLNCVESKLIEYGPIEYPGVPTIQVIDEFYRYLMWKPHLEKSKNIPYFISLDSLMLLRFFDMRQTILNIYLVAEKVI